MQSTTDEQIRALGRRWADAEQRGDVAALDALAAEDFVLVGPAGFVLNKQQWLDRYHTGALITRSLNWDDIEVRDYGDAAVAVGNHTQEAEYQGRSADGAFRATHIAIRRGDEWVLAGMHLSPAVAAPPRPTQSSRSQGMPERNPS